eukprot:snap_masked-scaffold_9-processed-gene-7.53-mRNA-1 protein AED:1.00 eAED:1.00 QI:0/0/0/0/1/1/2/0/70
MDPIEIACSMMKAYIKSINFENVLSLSESTFKMGMPEFRTQKVQQWGFQEKSLFPLTLSNPSASLLLLNH